MKRRDKVTDREILLKSDYELSKSADRAALKSTAARNVLPGGFKTAEQVEEFQASLVPVSTGCSCIDAVLDGGIRRRCVTEVYGESGCGKTQLCLQMAATAAARKDGVVYLSTEGSFPSARLQQFMTAAGGEESERGENIFIMRFNEVDDLMKCIRVQLPALLRSGKNISIIIIDSIAAPFRGSYHEAGAGITRAELLKEIGVKLLKYSKDYNLAVLCVNQVSANVSNDGKDTIVPCLGLAWSNMVTTRICMSKSGGGGSRKLRVVFSPDLPNPSIDYVIVSKGIFGAP